MPIRILDRLADFVPRYRGVLCDLWGAVHDGIRPYPGAVDCLLAIRREGIKVVLLSNAPRPSWQVQGFLTRMGVPADAYDEILTSGDATAAALNLRDDPEHAALGRRYYNLGPDRSVSLLEAITEAKAAPFDDAEFILNSGMVDDESETLDDYRPLLARALGRGLPMVCANPDRIVNRGERLVPCAGLLAEAYEAMGGRVLYHGKPHPDIYLRALEMLEMDRPETVMLGDGLPTDIEGAKRFGIDSIWIAGGIHAEDVGYRPGDAHLDGARVEAFCRREGRVPTAAVPSLTW
jgi:HAD superfamily hydrolase (TIGR01459 family)